MDAARYETHRHKRRTAGHFGFGGAGAGLVGSRMPLAKNPKMAQIEEAFNLLPSLEHLGPGLKPILKKKSKRAVLYDPDSLSRKE